VDVVSLVIVLVVAIFTSITAPIILARRTERQQRSDRLADYQRQDEVARLAAQAVEAQSSQAQAADWKLDSLARQAERIHTLVNSDMTAARQSELDQTRVLLAVLRRVVGLSKTRGQQPEPADLEALENAEARAAELERMLADRLHQLQESEAQARGHPDELG
jgi:hypothetical protein